MSAIDGRVTTLENAVPPTANDATVSFAGSAGITFPNNSSFTLDQSSDITIDIQGPDLSAYLQAPGSDGNYILTTSSGVTTYSEVIDLGTY